MSSNSEKGNISPFLLLIAVVIIVSLLFSFAKLMLFKPRENRKYRNPMVASKVVPGKIYDSKGNILLFYVPEYKIYFDTNRINSNQTEKAVEITSSFLNITASEIKEILALSKNTYILVGTVSDDFKEDVFTDELEKNNIQNGIYVEKTYIRNYPYGFHSKQLLEEISSVYSYILFPSPGLDTDITYGSDLHLTLDIDVQYLLDLSCEQIFNKVRPEYVTASLIKAENCSIIATATYPYSDKKMNLSLISELNGNKTYINQDCTFIKDSPLSFDLPETLEITANTQTGNIFAIPSESNPEYYLILGVKSPENISVSAFRQAVTEIETGLKSQSKLRSTTL